MTGSNNQISQRNYQLDVLKFIFTLFVVLTHTITFVDDTSPLNASQLNSLGWISVHFFFIVSGLLMVNSITKKEKYSDSENSGRLALGFTISKFKGFAMGYFVALFIGIALNMYYYRATPLTSLNMMSKVFPELFGLTEAGLFFGEINPAASWYISALLIVSLPLSYMLIKNRSSFLYVIAPLLAVTCVGYMYYTDPYMHRAFFNGLFLGGLVRALCGLCFGVIAWNISCKVSVLKKKSAVIFITVAEILLYAVFFLVFLTNLGNAKVHYSIMLILPIAIGITFSGVSYMSRLFRLSVFKHVGSISLAIFLTHDIARRFVSIIFPKEGYINQSIYMIAVTAVLCVVYAVVIKLVRMLWNKVLKPVFSAEKNAQTGGADNA